MKSLILGVALSIIFPFPSTAQEIEVDSRGTKMDLREIPTLMDDELAWKALDREECAQAYSRAFGERGNYPARERLSATMKLEACVDELKASAVSQTGGDLSRALSINLNFESVLREIEDNKKSATAQASFMGMAFGVGVGVSFSEDEIVSEAELNPENVIVATGTESQVPRVILESHYYGFCRSRKCNAGVFGVGPYFAIVAKSDKLLSAFSAGAMFGWKDGRPGTSGGFSVGIGALLDSSVKSLASGFEAGEPLPEGETQIRYEEKSRWSGLIFFTRTF